jgi:hypothetical protein
MKRRRKKNAMRPDIGAVANDFVRGFVSFAVITALEKGALPAKVAYRAAQCGIALVAGAAAGNAIERGDYPAMLLSAAGGLAGVYLLRRSMDNEQSEE